MKTKSLIELTMLKKKALMDNDTKLLNEVEAELLDRMLSASKNGRTDENRKKAIIDRRKKYYAKKKIKHWENDFLST